MNQLQELKNTVKNEVNKLVKDGCEKLNIKIPEYSVNFDVYRDKNTIAYCASYPGKNKFRYEFVFFSSFMKQDIQFYLKNILPHEVSHMLVKEYFVLRNNPFNRKITSHGREFKRICRLFPNYSNFNKATIKSDYKFESKRKNIKKFLYKTEISGKIVQLTIIRHRRIQNGQRYDCMVNGKREKLVFYKEA